MERCGLDLTGRFDGREQTLNPPPARPERVSRAAGSLTVDETSGKRRSSLGVPGGMDLVLGGATAVAAAVAAVYHPDKTVLRALLSVPALLLVPGYFLLQAILPSLSERPGWGRHLALSVGFSLPIVGLAALATAVTPWGFSPSSVAVSVMLASLALCGAAGYRRAGRKPGPEAGEESPEPQVHEAG